MESPAFRHVVVRHLSDCPTEEWTSPTRGSVRWWELFGGDATATNEMTVGIAEVPAVGTGNVSICPPFLKRYPQICPHPLRMGWIGLGGYGQLRCGFQRRKKKVRKSLRSYGLVRGARGRNRTGTPCGGGF